MHKIRSSLGLNREIDSFQKAFLEEYELINEALAYRLSFRSRDKLLKKFSFSANLDSLKAREFIRRSGQQIEVLSFILQELGIKACSSVIKTCGINVRYEGPIKQQREKDEKLSLLRRKKINWEELIKSKNISTECRGRIELVRPETFSQLQNIDGIRPATISYVACLVS